MEKKCIDCEHYLVSHRVCGIKVPAHTSTECPEFQSKEDHIPDVGEKVEDVSEYTNYLLQRFNDYEVAISMSAEEVRDYLIEFEKEYEGKEERVADTGKTIPIGVSEWMRQGKEYGYFDYVKKQKKDDFLEKLNKETKEMFGKEKPSPNLAMDDFATKKEVEELDEFIREMNIDFEHSIEQVVEQFDNSFSELREDIKKCFEAIISSLNEIGGSLEDERQFPNTKKYILSILNKEE